MPRSIWLAEISRITCSTRGESVPTTIRFGLSVSSTPWLSRRNSGLQPTSTASPAGERAWNWAAMRAAVPTGTVDLPMTTAGRVSSGANDSTAASTYRRSAALDVACCGVPTQMKCTSAKAAASA